MDVDTAQLQSNCLMNETLSSILKILNKQTTKVHIFHKKKQNQNIFNTGMMV